MPRSTLRRAERIQAILQRLADEETLSAAVLAGDFGVSAATMRRDLQILEDQRLLTRTHGGARAHDVAYELPVRYRGARRHDEKVRVATLAARLLPRGPLTIGLTGGTTTSEVARAIAGRVDLTIVTNALNIAADLAVRPRVKVIVTGGVTRTQSYELVGPLADATLAGLHLQIAVVGVDGIDAAAGLSTHDEVEAHTNRTMVERADRVMVVADGSKVGRVMLARIAPVERVSELVTDSSADPVALDRLRARGLVVHLVDAPQG